MAPQPVRVTDYILSVAIVCDADVTGTIVTLKSGAEMVMPGDNTTLTVELGENVAMAPGMRCVLEHAGLCLLILDGNRESFQCVRG